MVSTRRALFKKTLGGALLLAAAGAVPVALQKTRPRAARRPLRFFTPAEYSVFAAAADRVLATSPLEPATELGPLPSRPAAPLPSEVNVAEKADAFLAPLDEASAKDLKQLLMLFDNALFSVVMAGPPRPFTRMSAEEQDRQIGRAHV